MKKNRLQRKTILILVVILVLQTAALFYWTDLKAGYHIDELYSFEYTHLYTEEGWGKTARLNSLCELNVWEDADILKQNLIVSEQDCLLSMPAGGAVKQLVNGRNYFGILNLVEGIFDPGEVNKYPAIILNIVFLILIQIVLIAIFRKLEMKELSIILGVLMFGFMSLTIGLVLFVRFYMFSILLVLLIFYLHLIMWKSEKTPVRIICEIISVILIYLVYKNSELTIAISGPLIVIFAVGLLCRKRILQFLYYFVPLILAFILYLNRYTGFIDMMLDPVKAAESGYGTIQMVSGKVITITWDRFWNYLQQFFIRMFQEKYFGADIILLLFVVLFIALMVIKIIKNRKLVFSENSTFLFIVLGVVIVFLAFAAFADFIFTRYYSFAVSLMLIAMWYGFDRLVFNSWLQSRLQSIAAIAALVLVVASSLMPFVTKNVENLYMENRSMTEELEQYKDLDNLVIESTVEDFFSLYDCVQLCGDNTRIFRVADDEDGLKMEGPNRILLWAKKEADPELIKDRLLRAGYSINQIGYTVHSGVFVCQKIN